MQHFKVMFNKKVMKFDLHHVEALDNESTNEDFRGCSRDDKPVFVEEINKY